MKDIYWQATIIKMLEQEWEFFVKCAWWVFLSNSSQITCAETRDNTYKQHWPPNRLPVGYFLLLATEQQARTNPTQFLIAMEPELVLLSKFHDSDRLSQIWSQISLVRLLNRSFLFLT